MPGFYDSKPPNIGDQSLVQARRSFVLQKLLIVEPLAVGFQPKLGNPWKPRGRLDRRVSYIMGGLLPTAGSN